MYNSRNRLEHRSRDLGNVLALHEWFSGSWIISASPETFWDISLQGVPPLSVVPALDWHKGELQTCHFVNPLGSLPFDGSAWRNRKTFLRALGSKAPTKDIFIRHMR